MARKSSEEAAASAVESAGGLINIKSELRGSIRFIVFIFLGEVRAGPVNLTLKGLLKIFLRAIL